jgi:3-deoxy-D-manno-octulosonic-acid transferase
MIGALVTPRAYRGLGLCAGPLIDAWLAHRRRIGKEDPQRFGERLGQAGLSRPAGRLVWMHGASVGEGASLLPLIARLREAEPNISVLVTTGTVTSAQMLRKRLPEGALHQFAPIDRPNVVRRFLSHWQPDLGVWVESELWPNLVLETAARGTPLLLINARMSERSAARWRSMPRMIGPLMKAFDRVFAQTEVDAERFRALGARDVAVCGNLKNDAAPLDVDEAMLAALRRAIGDRHCWVAASTHEGEEAIVAEAHQRLQAEFADLLTIVVPRHPDRGAAIAASLESRGLSVARRATEGAVTDSTAIYLADTLGELGLMYRLADVVFVGGSLTPHGGHNLLEPARLDSAIVAGPSMENFSEACGALDQAGALETVADAAGLAEAVGSLFRDETTCRRRRAAAASVAQALGGAADAALDVIREYLVPPEPDARAGILGS